MAAKAGDERKTEVTETSGQKKKLVPWEILIALHVWASRDDCLRLGRDTGTKVYDTLGRNIFRRKQRVSLGGPVFGTEQKHTCACEPGGLDPNVILRKANPGFRRAEHKRLEKFAHES